MEIQRQRQRHLAEACQRRGHVVSDWPRLRRSVAQNIFVVDKIRTLYCVLGKVASTSWMQVCKNRFVAKRSLIGRFLDSIVTLAVTEQRFVAAAE